MPERGCGDRPLRIAVDLSLIAGRELQKAERNPAVRAL